MSAYSINDIAWFETGNPNMINGVYFFENSLGVLVKCIRVDHQNVLYKAEILKSDEDRQVTAYPIEDRGTFCSFQEDAISLLMNKLARYDLQSASISSGFWSGVR